MTTQTSGQNQLKDGDVNSDGGILNLAKEDTLIESLFHLIDENNVEQVIESQKNMLARFEKTNEMLVNCNALAMIRFENSSRELKRYTQQLVDMKKDLDSIFRRIRFLRFKLTQQYPEAFKACNNLFNVLDEEEEIEEAKDQVLNKES